MTQQQIDAIIDAVVAELQRQGFSPPSLVGKGAGGLGSLALDLPDITASEYRTRSYIDKPLKPDVLRALMGTTPSRMGIGHAGPRYRNIPQFIFWADHAVTQDALFKEIDPALLQQFNLFEVQTQASSRQEYLLRPDLGRKLSDAARKTLQEKCVKQPDVQLYVADGLSAAAIEHNLRDIFPVMQQGLQQAGLKMGTPFYVKYGRVGLLNDVNAIVDAKVVATLIGERPGLGRAEAASVYLGFKPQPDSTDADRDVVCNIFNGGTNPLEAGAYVVEYIKRTLKYQASGIKLKLIEQGK
ncbi:MAG: ethanolamine ammonia-lyase subunit EutC [Chloroflexi bacterium]|nr:ethanolamine ammonia-lyase subunit EutC [Chloroflexota bacterium]